MPTILGSFRRLVLTPRLADVSFVNRGFPVRPSESVRRLEAIPQSVICGFEWGIDTRDQWELERRLALVEPELRGFAYEGATMASTLLDVMPGPGRNRTRDLLLGPGAPHIFLAYIGIGFAMSHLPRPLWRKVLPDLTGSPYHPTMSWLAVDGYGFDRAYFDTRRWIDRQHRDAAYSWQGEPDYFARALDQGIGRALWFIHGGQVPDVSAAVRRFAVDRRKDLWSGVGLAATFAGGCGVEDLALLRRSARDDGQEYEAHLAVGAVFAAKARVFSGYLPEYSDAAVRALVGMSAASASALADRATGTGHGDGETRYEAWRRTIRANVIDTLDRSFL
jgi:hypothetical protein